MRRFTPYISVAVGAALFISSSSVALAQTPAFPNTMDITSSTQATSTSSATSSSATSTGGSGIGGIITNIVNSINGTSSSSTSNNSTTTSTSNTFSSSTTTPNSNVNNSPTVNGITTPGAPNTGAGGRAFFNLVVLLSSLFVTLGAVAYLARKPAIGF